MSHALFLRHRALPGRRDELMAVWERHMPAAIDANPDHEAYVYTTVDDDADCLAVFQQYSNAAAAAAFLTDASYLKYLSESEHLLAGPPEITGCTPHWSKSVGPDRLG